MFGFWVWKKKREHAMEEVKSESVSTGRWGEAVAAAFLMRKGWQVVGRNVRPGQRDRRCEIDLIVKSREGDDVVFVEVKTHAYRLERDDPLRGIDRRKKKNLLRACVNWVMTEKWHGNFRFDVIQVYGRRSSGQPPEIDHVEDVPLFPPKWRFW